MSTMSSFMLLESLWNWRENPPQLSRQLVVSVLYTLGALIAVPTVAFLVKLYLVRSKTLRLKRQGFAMPPVHPIFGHLMFLNSLMSKLPKDAHPHYLPDQIRRALPDLGPIYYIDAWPFLTPTLVVASPATLSQITQEHVLPKFPAIRSFLYPLTQGVDLVGMDGQQWKTWRSVFNPGFSASNLMNLVPGIVEDTKVFCDVLTKRSYRRSYFEMKSLTDNLAMDVIGRVIFDKQLHAQTSENRLVTAMRRQMEWLAFGTEGLPLKNYNPVRPFIHWFNTREMNAYLSPELDARFALHQSSDHALAKSKSVIDLALSAHLAGKTVSGATTQTPPPSEMSAEFKRFAMNQIKLFLFSGHDTTSSALCYTFYLLATHPAALSKLRAEHASLFPAAPGSASAVTAALLARNPHLLNQLPYTAAVIKESLRLFPPASTTRLGERNFAITDPATGKRYPTEHFLLWLVPHAVQRDPAYWPQPDAFLPERWLAPPEDPLYPTKGAWRPFEHGPRACIGLELSLVEMKTVLAMTARAFEIVPAYGEVDARERGEGIGGDVSESLGRGWVGARAVGGERAYQLQMGQPWGDLPCRVRVLGDGGE